MKKFLVLIAGLFLIFISLGCTAKQLEKESEITGNIVFIEEYERINTIEQRYNIYSKRDIGQFIDYLTAQQEQYLNFNTTDAKAIANFVEFRIYLLKAQENIIIADEKIELVVCENERTFEELIFHLESAEENAALALSSINNFKTNFEEYVAYTGITSETEASLNAILTETLTALDEMREEYSIACE